MQHLQVKRAAVLGAGVMGAQIASHFISAGIETFLYDLPAKEGAKNAVVEKAIKALSKLKPTPLAFPAAANLLQAKNYDDDLDALKGCDFIIEVIAERADLKFDLYKKITPFIHDKAVLVTNTSGLSVDHLAEALPASLRSRFCGVHFFNPPRYMHLAELIPTLDTSKELLDDLESFLVSTLGKGVVRAKDTPNFIANRIGVFSMLATMHLADKYGLAFDEVDALTGLLIGRPKSATFRTMDVVGLDTMVHVVNTMQEALKDDPWHRLFVSPDWLLQLVEKGALGQKTRLGIYKKEGKTICVLDRKTNAYVPGKAAVDKEVMSAFKLGDMKACFKQLQISQSKQAQFLLAYFYALYHYCAYHLSDIADTVRDVDLAIRWGFGWQSGPFESWQGIGFSEVMMAINNTIDKKESLAEATLPGWLKGIDCFYKEAKAFSPLENNYKARLALNVYKKQLYFDTVMTEKVNQGETIYEDDAVRLWHQGDDIALLSFKSKVNAIGEDVLDGCLNALDIAESDFNALVLWQRDAINFSVGANLKQFVNLFGAGKEKALDAVVAKFQQVAMRLKYNLIPTIAAVRGRALGGGCELLMHCNKVVTAFESYIGLVEVGVGLLPAGGGCKEFALRAQQLAIGNNPFYFLEKGFKTIAMAEVSQSGADAKHIGFTRENDVVVMNTDEVLAVAKAQARAMIESNFRPPMSLPVAVLGLESLARLKMIIVNMQKGGFISEHDALIVEKIAYVLCGGDLNEGTLVDEHWFLRLEREAFVALASTKKTLERVNYLLETGKPLRN